MDAASSATSPTPCSATSPSEGVAWGVGPTPSQRERFRAALRRHCLESRLLTSSSSSSPSSSSSSSPSAPQRRVPDAINVAHHHFNGEELRSSSVASPDVGAQWMPEFVLAKAPKPFPGQPAGAGASSAATSARPAKKNPGSASDKRWKQQQQPAPLAKATSATLASTSPRTLLSQHSPNRLTIAPLSSSLAQFSSGHRLLPRPASGAPLLLPTAPVEWPAPRKLRKVEEEAEGVVDHGILPLPQPARASHGDVGNIGGPLSVSDCCSLLQVPMPVTGGRMPPVCDMEGPHASSPASLMPAGRKTSSLATPGLQGGSLPDPVLEPPCQAFRHSDGGAPLPGAFVAAASASPQYYEQWRKQLQQQKLQGEGSAAVLPESVELKQAAEATLCGNPDAAEAGILPVTHPASGWMTWAAGEQSEPEELSAGEDTRGGCTAGVDTREGCTAAFLVPPEQQPAADHLPGSTALSAAPLTVRWPQELLHAPLNLPLNRPLNQPLNQPLNRPLNQPSAQGTQLGPGSVWLPCLESLEQADRLMSLSEGRPRMQSAAGTSLVYCTPDQFTSSMVGIDAPSDSTVGMNAPTSSRVGMTFIPTLVHPMNGLVGPAQALDMAMGARRGPLGACPSATASHPDALNMSQSLAHVEPVVVGCQWPGTWLEAHPVACEPTMSLAWQPGMMAGWMQQSSGSGPGAAAWLQRQGPGDLSSSACQGVSPGSTRTPVTHGDHFRVTPCLDTGHGLSHAMGLEGGPRSDALANAGPLRWPLGQVDMGRQGEPLRQAANEGVMGLTGCSAPCQADSAMLGQADSAAGPGGLLQAAKGGDVDEAGGSDHGSAACLSSRKEERGEGTGEEPQGDKKIKRLMSNRASAKRSRERKQDRLQELEVASAKLRVEEMELQRQLEGASNTLESYKRKNKELRDELHELKSQAKGKCFKLTS